MTRLSLAAAFIVAFAFTFAMPLDSRAADPPSILQAVVINTNGNTDALLAEAEKTREIFKRLGIDAKRRYLQASLAGDQTGSIAVTIEYPNLKSLAEAQEKLQDDKEWQDYIQGFTEKGMTVESNSIWVDRTP
jgi:hypothetical protein